MMRACDHDKNTRTIKALAVAGAVIGQVMAAMPACANDGGHGGGGGLPQMDATQYPGLLFWLVICFSLLFLLMNYWIVPQIQEAQGNRRGLMDADLTAAREASEHAQDMMANYEKALTDARTKAFAMVDSLVKQSMEESERLGQKQQVELQNRLDDAHKRIESARDVALKEVPKAVDELVDAIVAKYAGKKAA